jgi:hypothetical protein
MKIKEAIDFIFDTAGIKCKDDLDIWCGKEGRKRLYIAVRKLAKDHWVTMKEPECNIRAIYEGILPGYKIFKNKVSYL